MTGKAPAPTTADTRACVGEPAAKSEDEAGTWGRGRESVVESGGKPGRLYNRSASVC